MLNECAEIARPINCAMGALGTALAIFISGGGSASGYLIGAVTAFMVMAAGNALNDYMDVEIDRIAHPNRPLPSGRMRTKSVPLPIYPPVCTGFDDLCSARSSGFRYRII